MGPKLLEKLATAQEIDGNPSHPAINTMASHSQSTGDDEARLRELERTIDSLSGQIVPRIASKSDAKRFKTLLDAKEEKEMILEQRRVSGVVSENIREQSFECHVCSKRMIIPSLEKMLDHSFMENPPTEAQDLIESVGDTVKIGFSMFLCCGKNACMECFGDYVTNGCPKCGDKYPDDEQEALLLTLKLAEQGNPWAQFEAGVRMKDKSSECGSKEVQRTLEEQAVDWLQQAVAQGVAGAASMLARLADGTIPNQTMSKDLKERRPIYEVAAGLGHPYSQCMLGAICDEDSGDDAEAVKWSTLR